MLKISEYLEVNALTTRERAMAKKTKVKEQAQKAKSKKLEFLVKRYKQYKKDADTIPRLLAAHQKKKDHSSAWGEKNLAWKDKLKKAKQGMTRIKVKLKNHPDLKARAGIK